MQRSFGEAARILFDPGATLLFIVGSIVLGVLGNSIYDLIVERLATVPNRLVIIAVSSAMILFAIVVALLLWLNRPRPKIKVALSPERHAEPAHSLVLLVSPGDFERSSEKVAVEHHTASKVLQHCWLIVSPEAAKHEKLSMIKQMLASHRVHIYEEQIDDGYQANLAYMAAERVLKAAQNVSPNGVVTVDITGGTKTMTSGAVLAAFANSVSIEYVLGKYNEQGERDPRVGSVVMKVDQTWN